MRCLACNYILTDVEATNLSSTTLEHLDLCTPCIKKSGIQHIQNPRVENIDEQTHDDDVDYDEMFENDALGG